MQAINTYLLIVAVCYWFLLLLTVTLYLAEIT